MGAQLIPFVPGVAFGVRNLAENESTCVPAGLHRSEGWGQLILISEYNQFGTLGLVMFTRKFHECSFTNSASH